MLIFRSEAHADNWCQKWRFEKGYTFSPEQQWQLARAWYADRMDFDWRRKTEQEAREIFTDIGLTGEFWRVGA